MTQHQPDPVDVHVGRRVRQRRMAINLSQQKLGDALGLTFQQVQKYERGGNRISASRLHQIAHNLQVPVAWFFEGAPGLPVLETGTAVPDFASVFLTDKQGLALAEAFVAITDPATRTAIINIAQAAAGVAKPKIRKVA